MDILTRLKKALAEGATLAALGVAGCSAPVIPSLDSGQMVVEDAGSKLPPHDGGLGCFGPSYDAGYHGRCCNSLRCRECSAGPMLPPGSGTCSCGTPASSGPYAAEDGGTDCCWIVGSIVCDGRPLLVDGEAVTAPVVSRSDWA